MVCLCPGKMSGTALLDGRDETHEEEAGEEEDGYADDVNGHVDLRKVSLDARVGTERDTPCRGDIVHTVTRQSGVVGLGGHTHKDKLLFQIQVHFMIVEGPKSGCRVPLFCRRLCPLNERRLGRGVTVT